MIGKSMKTILETEGLTKEFGGLTAVDHVDLKIPRGKIEAIIGPNGAGKTTFFNLLSGLLEPTSGDITYKGERITDLSIEERSQQGIARSFQLTQIFPALPTLENVRIAAQSRAGFGTSYNLLSRTESYGKFFEVARGLLEKVGLDEEYGKPAKNLRTTPSGRTDRGDGDGGTTRNFRCHRELK